MPGRRTRLSLVATIMGSFVAGLDATAVNVALPAIRANVGWAGGPAVGCLTPTYVHLDGRAPSGAPWPWRDVSVIA